MSRWLRDVFDDCANDDGFGRLFGISALVSFFGLTVFVLAQLPYVPTDPPGSASPRTETRPVFSSNSNPPPAATTAQRSSPHMLRVDIDANGQFFSPCRIDTVKANCLWDTGAGETYAVLVIDVRTARKAGVDIASLSFDDTGGGIGGRVQEAKAHIERVQIGPFSVNNAPVVVVDSPIDVPPLITPGFMRHFKVTISGGETLTVSE
jgi:predicted aspartyl protease